MKKQKKSSHLLFVIGCVLCGVAVVAFVISYFLLFVKTDGTNLIANAFNKFVEAVTSLFGSGKKGGSYTYGLLGLSGVTVFVTLYFAIIFLKAKKYKGFVASLLNLVTMAMFIIMAEAVISTIVTKTGGVRLRAYGGMLIVAVPGVLSFLSLLILEVVSFADQTSSNTDKVDFLQAQIDELRKELEESKTAKEEVKEEPANDNKAQLDNIEAKLDDLNKKLEAATSEEDKDSETVVDAETGITYIVRYNKAFSAKLSLANDDVRNWYNEIKKYILSFGANSRVSWNFDSFNVGRKQVAKLNIKGKTLSIYVALDPKDYTESKYHAKDVSDSKKYEQTPIQMKIKSDRGVKFAKELIDLVMAQLGKESDGNMTGDYREPKKSFNTLFAEGLIKESKTQLKVAAPAVETKEETSVKAETAPVKDEIVEEGEEVTDYEAVEEPEEVESDEELAEEEKESTSKNEKTIYHVSKRENDGREWKVFKQGSKKVIKLFPTQKEAFDFARQLAKNKGNGSIVLLHGLDGKIRKY